MKILILGCKGQLGRCLNDELLNTDNKIFFRSRDQMDITDFASTKSQILDINPDVLINAAAYTAVDKAEEDRQKADLINHLAVENIAKICNLVNCWFIHLSTDYVFDGTSNFPYKEDDQTNPQSVYGETKLKGECAIQSSCCKHIIIRTSWVFSQYGNNFLKSILRLASDQDELSIVGDQIGCPTYAQDIAKVIETILPQLNSRDGLSGVYHYCGGTACSWFDFAEEVFKQLNKIHKTSIPILRKVTTEEFPTIARRPKFSVLDNKKIQEKFNIFPCDWKVGVGLVLKKVDIV